jgi:hypothetical protein
METRVNGILNNSNRLLMLLLFCMKIKYQFLHARWNRKLKARDRFSSPFSQLATSHQFLLLFCCGVIRHGACW